MKFEKIFDFDYPADAVMNMFSDEAYFLRKYERLDGSKAEHLDTTQREGHFAIEVRYGFSTSEMNLPEFIRSRMAKEVSLRQLDKWDIPERKGRIDIDFEKTPADVVIEMTLHDKGETSQLVMDFEITVNIPMMRARVEKAISGPLTRRVMRDLEISNEMAANYVDA